LSKTTTEHLDTPAATARDDIDAALMVGAMGIAAVERDTGLSKDLLRVWERRYGFPQPLRDEQGERLYPQEQVLRLRQVKRLLDAGHRPSHVVALPPQALVQRLQSLPDASSSRSASVHTNAVSVERLDELLAPLLNHQLYAFQEALQSQMLLRGLSPYITEVLAPLTARIGHLWTEGRLQIYEEHLFTEVVQQQLHRAIGMLTSHPQTQRPRLLLSTLPGEEHGLGLLMAQALLTLQGCHCLSLGTQTPVGDLLAALRTQQADALVLSFSGYASTAMIESGVGHLVDGLPAGTELWVGGSAAGLRRIPARWPGVRMVASLAGLADTVQAWRTR
jgi:MerR family transcriptional regulator, light-induced transcriptional regulator